ncbi:transmembrane emp24 domain-containing protein 1-like [Carassius auratus]|uniref:Transmembrane emp24 domain-containing protein 1-like n=1 Tax=Carassius auratus TaxID=7957 RepID=A0A6P6KTB7_CARAU|nr:transmembrane emp24 domain-containing protein 1-like [Carassius auratus]
MKSKQPSASSKQPLRTAAWKWNQVIAGSGLDIGFTLISPHGYRLVSDFRKSDGISFTSHNAHWVDHTEEGDYKICFDNSFNHTSEKMVYVKVIVDGPEEEEDDEDWAAVAEPEDSLEYKLEDIGLNGRCAQEPGAKLAAADDAAGVRGS